MMKNMRRGIPSLFKEGSKHFSGVEQAVLKNVEACRGLSEITKTSFGPNGMNKMVINHLERLFVTSDTATIIKEMDVVHPAAKMVVMAAGMQEREIGDGSNFVVIFAGELLQQAESLIYLGLHPSSIVEGYSQAGEKALEILEDLVVITEENLHDAGALARGVKSAVAAKQYGYEDFLAPLIANACLNSMPKNATNFVVDNVRTCKIMGGSVFDAEVVHGMVITKCVEGSVHRVEDAKIVVFVGSIDTVATETKGTVVFKSADDLMHYNLGEEKHIEALIKSLADAGVKVAVTGTNIGEMAMHFLAKFKIMALKIQSKFELRRLCRAVRARPLVQLGPATPEDLGHCSEVFVKEIGGTKVTVFSQKGSDSPVSTIVIRGSTNNLMDDIERAIDDGVNVVKAMTRDARFLPGAGATEIELSRRLGDYAAEEPSISQYALRKYAESFEVFPRILADSSGMDHTSVLADLYAAHESEEKNASKIGISIEKGCVGDMSKDGVLDLFAAKHLAVKLATDVVTTILRVDQIIMSKPAGGPKMPQNKGHWDAD